MWGVVRVVRARRETDVSTEPWSPERDGLRIRGLSEAFPPSRGQDTGSSRPGNATHVRAHPPFAPLDLTVALGEQVAIVGPPGAGKTTLLGLIAGRIPATAERITFDGEDWNREPGARRRSIGWVGDDPPARSPRSP